MRIATDIIVCVLVLSNLVVAGAGEIQQNNSETAAAPGALRFISHGIPGKNITGYWIYLPETHHTSRSWPVLLFLHGGGMGENPDIHRVKKYGPLKNLLDGTPSTGDVRNLLKEFIIVSPILPENPKNFTLWIDNINALDAVIDTMIERHWADPDRLYVTGSSRGAGGAWRFPKHSRHNVAAIVPVCGFYMDRSNLRPLADIPVWITCNTGDRLYNTQKRAVAAIEALGGEKFLLLDTANPAGGDFLKRRHILTSFAKKGHDAWTATYSSAAIYRWMLNFKNIDGTIVREGE